MTFVQIVILSDGNVHVYSQTYRSGVLESSLFIAPKNNGHLHYYLVNKKIS